MRLALKQDNNNNSMLFKTSLPNSYLYTCVIVFIKDKALWEIPRILIFRYILLYY